MGVPETVTDLLEPVVATLDVELLDVEWNGTALRVVVDTPRADGGPSGPGTGVTTEQLAAVNRLISPILDQHDPVPGRYTLEVSSPGVERRLARPEHVARAIGEDVVVKLRPDLTPRRVKGRLTAFDPTTGTMTIEPSEVDGIPAADADAMSIPFDDVTKARTSFDWGPGPKPGKGSKGGSRPQPPRRQLNQQLNQQLKKEPS